MIFDNLVIELLLSLEICEVVLFDPLHFGEGRKEKNGESLRVFTETLGDRDTFGLTFDFSR